jgi:hypothetical protein
MIPVNETETDNKKDYYNQEKSEDALRNRRLHDRHIKITMDKLRLFLRVEARNLNLSEKQKNVLIMDPVEFLSKTFLKISLVNLYRRYRQVRMQALTECLSIVGTGKTQEDNLESIRNKIIECGQAHKDSLARENQNKIKSATAMFRGKK